MIVRFDAFPFCLVNAVIFHTHKKNIFFFIFVVQFQIWLIALHVCTCEETSTESSTTPKTMQLTAADAREKRTLSNFDSNRNFHRQPHSNGPAQIQRRIQNNFLPYPDAASNYIDNYNGASNAGIGPYDKDYSFDGYKQQQYQPQSYQSAYTVENSQYGGGGYQQQQYVEAPEPIIEIIIKESNETLPAPAALQYQPPKKKKKEQVQVFYVKYNKDKEHGLVIDDPIPGMCRQGICIASDSHRNLFFKSLFLSTFAGRFQSRGRKLRRSKRCSVRDSSDCTTTGPNHHIANHHQTGIGTISQQQWHPRNIQYGE